MEPGTLCYVMAGAGTVTLSRGRRQTARLLNGFFSFFSLFTFFFYSMTRTPSRFYKKSPQDSCLSKHTISFHKKDHFLYWQGKARHGSLTSAFYPGDNLHSRKSF